MTYLFQENFKYRFAFYVPLHEKVILADQPPSIEDANNKRVHEAIQMIFANFGLRIQVLDQATIKEQAQAIHETISTIMDEGIEIPEPFEGEPRSLEEIAQEVSERSGVPLDEITPLKVEELAPDLVQETRAAFQKKMETLAQEKESEVTESADVLEVE